MNKHKRIYRELSDETRAKISKATAQKPKSASHKAHLSQSLKRYWRSVPHKPEHTTMNDLLGKEQDK